jgi:hypothetical protein
MAIVIIPNLREMFNRKVTFLSTDFSDFLTTKEAKNTKKHLIADYADYRDFTTKTRRKWAQRAQRFWLHSRVVDGCLIGT